MLAQQEDLPLLLRERGERRLELRPQERPLRGAVRARSPGTAPRRGRDRRGARCGGRPAAAPRPPPGCGRPSRARSGRAPGASQPSAARTTRRNVSWQRSSARPRSPVSLRRKEKMGVRWRRTSSSKARTSPAWNRSMSRSSLSKRRPPRASRGWNARGPRTICGGSVARIGSAGGVSGRLPRCVPGGRLPEVGREHPLVPAQLRGRALDDDPPALHHVGVVRHLERGAWRTARRAAWSCPPP